MYPNPWKKLPDPYDRFIWQEDAFVFRSELSTRVPPQYRYVVAELGIGNGALLKQMAASHPEVYFLGVELYYKPLGQAAKRLHRNGIHNAQLIRYNALHPAILFPDCFLDGLIVNFPEPWPKAKHHKYRIFFGPFASQIRKVLKLDGWVFLQTDQKSYFDAAKTLLSQAQFQVQEDEYPFVMAPAARSYFHNLFESKGDPIYRLLAKQQSI